MKAAVILIAIALSASGVTADWWADFSNNLFTDLTPLISLFGEQPTKQFLGESVTYLDYFIFAMAPLGILTAVVSAIRVRGGPSLRAFIGSAQEGAGGIEAELCSSTSRDICELYDSGGISRVFGIARLLESSLTTLCAQELYASFISAAMSILDYRESIVSIKYRYIFLKILKRIT